MSELAARVLARVPELASWDRWYRPPRWLENGHAHTILSSQLRKTRAVRYYRELLRTPDGGTLALDMLTAVARRSGEATDDKSDEDDWAKDCLDGTCFDNSSPPPPSSKPFLLLTSGLGGGSQDHYVRGMAAEASERGWQVGVLNMRSCGGAPVTSPRFFSACRGSNDDLRLGITHVRRKYLHGTTDSPPLALIGWSNGGSIVINYLAEQGGSMLGPSSARLGARSLVMGRVDAAAALACPLNLPAGMRNLQRWFHKNVYDRAIAKSLATKFSSCRELFETDAGAPRELAQWGGLGEMAGTFVTDVEGAANARTVRGVDEALTRRCFGFDTVDEYYAHASSDQRIDAVQVPLLLLSAADDPIAPGFGIPTQIARRCRNVFLAVTKFGGHLGWCDETDAFGAPHWAQRATLGFLEASLNLSPKPPMIDSIITHD